MNNESQSNNPRFQEIFPNVLAQRDPTTGEIYVIHKNQLRRIVHGTESYEFISKFLPEISWSHNYPASPRNIQVQITKACNFSCTFCYASAINESSPKAHMSFENAKRIIDIAYDWGVPQLQWVGGETFVNKQFKNIVAYTQARGLVQNIITNAVIPGLQLEHYRETLAAFAAIQISVNALDEDFNSIVGRNIFSRLINAIHNIRRHNENIWISCVVTPINAKYLDKVVALGESVRAKGLIFGILAKQGRAIMPDTDYFSCLKDARKSLQQSIEHLVSDIEIDCHFDPTLNRSNINTQNKCIHGSKEGQTVLFINKDGDVFPFPLLEDESLKIGNIFQHDITKLWTTSPTLSNIRTSVQDPEECKQCAYDCALRSRAMRFLWTGSFSGKIPCFLYDFKA